MRLKPFIKSFTEKAYSDMVDELNLVLTNLGLDNFNGQIITIALPSNVEIAIPHRLKRQPKYRIILRKSSAGDIIDGVKAWSSNIIYLKNTGVTVNNVTLFIL